MFEKEKVSDFSFYGWTAALHAGLLVVLPVVLWRGAEEEAAEPRGDPNAYLKVALLGYATLLYFKVSQKKSPRSRFPSKKSSETPSTLAPRSNPALDPPKGAWVLLRSGTDEFTWRFTETSTVWQWPEFNRRVNPSVSDTLARDQLMARSSLPLATFPVSTPADAALRGALAYARQADHTGIVPNDYSGPMFLLPGMIIALYVVAPMVSKENKEFQRLNDHATRAGMTRYLLAHQRAEDGGWGNHLTDASTQFCTSLNYTALRLLGLPASHEACVRARAFMFAQRRLGVLGAPLWAKAWLATLGCYAYEGMPAVPPELWLLPTWFPFHLGKTWCHARQVGLALSDLYGRRFVYPEAERDDLIRALRRELYPAWAPYETVAWVEFAREFVDPMDEYPARPGWILRVGNRVIQRVLEPWVFEPLGWRARALEETARLLRREDEASRYGCLGPVNKALNLVCCAARGDLQGVERHIEVFQRYLWVAEDGVKMQGYLNCWVWDASFAALAVRSALDAARAAGHAANATKPLEDFLNETCDFLERHQLQEVDDDAAVESPARSYRDPTCAGGWGFGSKTFNTYVVSDCTSEAGRALLRCRGLSTRADLSKAVDLIMSLRNERDDGVWASYERRRGHAWYERLNPALVFADIMIDYSYVECTSSCVQFLVAYLSASESKSASEETLVRERELREAVGVAETWLRAQQRRDGAWFGKWGVCFTYATWFAVEGLASARRLRRKNPARRRAPEDSACLVRAAEFLLGRQDPTDGGWGETVEACVREAWVPAPSNVVHTSWALLSLVRIQRELHTLSSLPEDLRARLTESRRRSVSLIMSKQNEREGDWSRTEAVYGVFNRTCGITYTSYRNLFPIWALAEHARLEREVSEQEQ